MAGSGEPDAVFDRGTAGADVTRDMGINASRTGEGSRPSKECNRARTVAGGGVPVGRSTEREGGVGDGDWD
jgi:hypothetical protein